MDAETYTLAPSIIADKARRLAASGLHRQALELLERNCVVAEIHATHVEMRLATELNGAQQRANFLGGWRRSRPKKRP